MIKILAIPGSLRANASSFQILRALAGMAPAGTSIEIYQGVGSLPHFDDSEKLADEVIGFRDKLRDADAVLICTPEYAFGVPGSLKNALDWTVSSGEFVNKPVGLITASSQGEKGHAAMLLILTALSANTVKDATLLISFVRTKMGPEGQIKDQTLSGELENVLRHLADAVAAK